MEIITESGTVHHELGTAMTIEEMSPEALARMVENTEAAAYADQLSAAPAAWRCVAEQTADGWVLVAPTLNLLLFNRLVGWGLERPAQRSRVQSALDRYRAAGVTNFGVQLSPVAKPSELADWLADLGLSRRDSWSKVYRAAGDAPVAPTSLRVEPVTGSDANAFAAITCASFGMPRQLEPWIASMVGRAGWHHYLAWDGRDPVGAGALFVRDKIGWLGVAGTLPAARRRGAQSALMARRIADGGRLGCRWLVTETGQDTAERYNPSFHNMMRAGFKVAYHRPNYLA
jgi:hypothetical protein